MLMSAALRTSTPAAKGTVEEISRPRTAGTNESRMSAQIR